MLFDKMKSFFGKKKKNTVQPNPLGEDADFRAELERIREEAARDFAEEEPVLFEAKRAKAELRPFEEDEPPFDADKRAKAELRPFEEDEPPFDADKWAKVEPGPFEEDEPPFDEDKWAKVGLVAFKGEPFRTLENAQDDSFAEMERIKAEMDSAQAEAARIRAEAARIRAEAEAARIRAEAARTQAAEGNPLAAPKPWRKEFTFQGRTPEWVNVLNAELSGRKFTELKLENFSGYLSTERRTDADGREISVSYRYGLDNCVMAGQEAEEGFTYRMDTEVTDSNVDSQIFADSWRMKHPGRVIRVLTCVGFNEKHAFIILHHEKAAEPQPAAPQPWRKEFTFPGRTPEWVNELNAELSGRKFTELKLENFSGYLSTERRTDADGREISVSYRYGLDNCVMAGQEAEEGFVYRMDTEVTDSSVDNQMFIERWRAQHPDRVIRVLTCVGFNEKHAFILLHHKKAAEPQSAAPQLWRKEFTFPGRGPEWLDELNAALSMKRFADLKLESFHGYFVSESRTDAEGRSISAVRYGLDDCVLAGREAADGFICRVAAEVFSSVVPSKHFEMMWRGRHPGCSVVSLTCVNQGAQNAYIILYHSR